MEGKWRNLNEALMGAADKMCGETKEGRMKHEEQWWWLRMQKDKKATKMISR